jgi:NAD+ kinase
MKFGLTANPRIPSALAATKVILSHLEPAHEVSLEADIAKDLGRKGVPLAHMKADAMLAVGGDGTILRALQLSNSPILGINTGSLGFLAEVNADESPAALERVIRGDYRLEERLKLKIQVEGERMFDCTNEAVVHTAQVAKIRHFELSVDDELVERVRADGMIVATPTGSTSYSMSTGGPIVDPRVEAITVTAIAPFRPASRPHVFPATSQVHVRLVRPKECLLVMDGQHETHLNGTEDAAFTGSERRARFIRFRQDFYRRIEEKLSRQ